MFNSYTYNDRAYNAAPILGAAAFNARASVIIDGIRLGGLSATMAAITGIIATGNYRATGAVAFQAIAAQNITGIRLQQGSLEMAAITNILADGVRVIFGGSTLSSATGIEAQGVLIISGSGVFVVLTEMAAQGLEAKYFINRDRILDPLNVIVLGDSKFDLLPEIEWATAEIPGRGEVILGTSLGDRIIELHVVPNGEFYPGDRERIKRILAGHLNPTQGYKTLVFADDMTRTYLVKYAGKIGLRQSANWLEFTISFRARPYILETAENRHRGNGILHNKGNAAAPLIIEVTGPDENPSITVGAQALTYTGTIEAGKTLRIDTEKLTVEIDGANAIPGYSGGFPKLPPGETAVTAGDNVTFIWRGRWI